MADRAKSHRADVHEAALALNFAYYNFCRTHQTFRVTPAMQAGITDDIWRIKELLSQ